MHRTDLTYRREVHGITRRMFAELLGRDYQTVAKWENGERDHPPWLQDWLEYMDMELIRGRMPMQAPRLVKDIEAILYPGREQNRLARRAARRIALQERDARRTIRQQQRANHERMERNRRKDDGVDRRRLGLPPIGSE